MEVPKEQNAIKNYIRNQLVVLGLICLWAGVWGGGNINCSSSRDNASILFLFGIKFCWLLKIILAKEFFENEKFDPPDRSKTTNCFAQLFNRG